MSDYPIVITRDLTKAKQWLRNHRRGLRTSGLVCSSGGKRLRPLGVDPNVDIDVARWFLSDKNDIESSSFNEVPATEFKIQGLELDWVCLVWDINLSIVNGKWVLKRFTGSDWVEIDNIVKRNYLLNAYRVLLTRAREGLVIFVPCGDPEDITRPPASYDAVFNFLRDSGATELP